MSELIEALRLHLRASLGRPVQLIETHISWLLLDGEHAWKIKRPLKLGFLDFGSLAARLHYCEEELRLNRRLAPALYLDVAPIRGSPSAPRLAGEGEPIEYAVRMKQFPNGSLFAERLAAGTLEVRHLDVLAERLGAFHASAPAVRPRSASVGPGAVSAAGPHASWGSAAQIESTTARTLVDLAARAGERRCAGVRDWLEAQGRRLRPTFERRKASGMVRECHGDLHLGNLLVLGEDATAFDCLEFDPALRWIDIQSDVAFLAMDLSAHGRRDLAFRFLDGWLQRTGDYAGLAVLRYYMVYRACVRALVSRIREAQTAAAKSGSPWPDYLALAHRLTGEWDPRLLITHGVSGSGKSFAAQRLLEGAAAVRLRSDVERKRSFGLRALDDSSARVPQGIYGPEANERTYARLLEVSGLALDAGYPTIVDAAFLRADERDRFRDSARKRRVPFAILHCVADPGVLHERVSARRASGADPSEAGLEVLARQLADHDSLTGEERRVAIELDTSRPISADAIRRWLEIETESDR